MIHFRLTRNILILLSRIFSPLDLTTKSIKTPFINLDKNKSIFRWGDGETRLLLGDSIHFQSASIRLQWLLLRLLIEAKKNPTAELHFPRLDSVVSEMRSTEALLRVVGNRDLHFGALAFREHNQLQKIAESAPQNCLLLCSDLLEAETLRVVFNGFQKTLHHVLVPPTNSLNFFLKQKVNDFQRYDLILVAAGPGGKIFGWKLHKAGKIVWDIGHGVKFWR